MLDVLVTLATNHPYAALIIVFIAFALIMLPHSTAYKSPKYRR